MLKESNFKHDKSQRKSATRLYRTTVYLPEIDHESGNAYLKALFFYV